MPTSTRRQARARAELEQTNVSTIDNDIASDEVTNRDVDASPEPINEEIDDEANDQEGSEQELEGQLLEDDIFPPPGLKEISSLASWTVSTAKPGNGVAALRSPDTSLFWQSDGPQPHLLSIHFFKLVSIVHMRIFLDFQNDESYTPTKIQFLAGMGVHDIQEFAEMSFDRPTGWIDVDFTSIGPIEDDDEENEDDEVPRDIDWSKRPVLRAFLVQVRILENHQNGKDTHLRAVQLFARDQSQDIRRVDDKPAEKSRPFVLPSHTKRKTQHTVPNNIKLASWMMEPDLR